MEHVNKQQRVNLDLFESHHSDSNSKPFMEGINIAILIFLGCSGLYIYSSLLTPKEHSINFSGITTNAVLIKDNAEVPKKKLLIGGLKQTGEKVLITIEGFDSQERYTLDFGDGNTQVVAKEKITHTYNKVGKYTLLLKVGHLNDPIQKIKKEIYIN
jgi:PKD domain-containing protein